MLSGLLAYIWYRNEIHKEEKRLGNNFEENEVKINSSILENVDIGQWCKYFIHPINIPYLFLTYLVMKKIIKNNFFFLLSMLYMNSYDAIFRLLISVDFRSITFEIEFVIS